MKFADLSEHRVPTGVRARRVPHGPQRAYRRTDGGGRWSFEVRPRRRRHIREHRRAHPDRIIYEDVRSLEWSPSLSNSPLARLGIRVFLAFEVFTARIELMTPWRIIGPISFWHIDSNAMFVL